MISAISLLHQRLAANLERAFTFRKCLPAPEWAETVRRMEEGRRFRFDFAPYQREMMATPYDPKVQLTVFQMASRLGKTEVVMNILGHAIAESPRRILVLYPTTSQAEKWSKETLEKELFEPTAPLEWLVRGGRRNSNNTILHKLFPGGLINIFGGNAPGEMRRAKGNLLFADEVSALQATATDEGDQLEIFWMRGSEYPDAIKIAASYPGVTGECRITRLMEGSDYRKWYVPCARCAEPFVMTRDHLRYPDGEPEKAVLECPSCGGEITDDDRREMLHAGEWRATKEFKGVAGFWANGFLWPHPTQDGFVSYLHQVAAMVDKIEKADNPGRAKHVLANTFDAVAYTPEVVEAPDPAGLLARREDYDARVQLPEGVLVVTAGVDVQKTWLEVSVIGWGSNKESWLLDHAKVAGGPDSPDTWQRLETFLAGCKYKHPSGKSLEVFGPGGRTFVDAGHWDQHVLPWTFQKSALGVFACQGSPTVNAPVIGRPKVAPTPKARIYPVGVNQCKDILYTRLALGQPPPGELFPPGYVHFPQRVTASYFEGLTCEYGREEIYRGESYVRYVNPPSARNEPLDTFVYAMAARAALNPNMKKLAEKMAPGDDAPKPKRKRPRARNWIMR